MALFDHMRLIDRGCPGWLNPGHYQNALEAARLVKRRTGVECWLDSLGRRIFFGRMSGDSLIAGLFEHPLYRPDQTPVRFGTLDGEINPEHVVLTIQIANAPQELKAKWADQRRFLDESEKQTKRDEYLYDPDRLRGVERTIDRMRDRRGMGKHYRPSVLV